MGPPVGDHLRTERAQRARSKGSDAFAQNGVFAVGLRRDDVLEFGRDGHLNLHHLRLRHPGVVRVGLAFSRRLRQDRLVALSTPSQVAPPLSEPIAGSLPGDRVPWAQS